MAQSIIEQYNALDKERRYLLSIITHGFPTIECVKEYNRIEAEQLKILESIN